MHKKSKEILFAAHCILTIILPTCIGQAKRSRENDDKYISTITFHRWKPPKLYGSSTL